MPSRLKRYQTFDQDHFITFTCYHRLPFLDDAHARDTFEEILETLRQRHQFLIHDYAVIPEQIHPMPWLCLNAGRAGSSTLP